MGELVILFNYFWIIPVKLCLYTEEGSENGMQEINMIQI